MIKRLLSILTLSVLLMMVNPAHAVFIGTGNGDLYNLNVSTNTSVLIGNSGTMFDIALDPTSGLLYGLSGSGFSLSLINTTNAAPTFIGGTGSGLNGLTFDSAGTLYASGGNSLFTVNLGSGAASLIGNTGYTSSGDIAFDSSGNLFMSAI